MGVCFFEEWDKALVEELLEKVLQSHVFGSVLGAMYFDLYLSNVDRLVDPVFVGRPFAADGTRNTNVEQLAIHYTIPIKPLSSNHASHLPFTVNLKNVDPSTNMSETLQCFL